MLSTMRAARLHAVGEPMRIDQVCPASATGTDIVVEVKALRHGAEPRQLLANWETWYPQMPMPPRPAIHGLDPAASCTSRPRRSSG